MPPALRLAATGGDWRRLAATGGDWRRLWAAGRSGGGSGGDNRHVTDNPISAEFADAPLRVLEDDENVPPRPEEELADLERAEPDPR